MHIKLNNLVFARLFRALCTLKIDFALASQILLLALLILLSFSASARTSYRFEHLVTGDGPSVGATQVIYQDIYGFIWLGGDNGAARYNGSKFTIYLPDAQDANSLPHSYVWDIKDDADGNLWFATSGGLSRFDRASNTFYNYKKNDKPESISSHVIRRIYIDSQKNLWVATEGGLDLFDAKIDGFIHHRHDPNNPDSISDDYIKDMFEDSDGQLWIGTRHGGMNIYDRENKKFIRFEHPSPLSEELKKAPINQISEDMGRNLWIATDNGLFQYNKTTKTLERHLPIEGDKNSLTNERIERILIDDENQLWAITNSHGLNVYDREKNNFTRYTHNIFDSSSIGSNQLLSIFQDRAGDYWIGLFPVGVDYINSASSEFTVHKKIPNEPNSLLHDTTSIIHPAMDEKIWIGGEGGLSLYDPENDEYEHFVQDANVPGSLGANAILSLTTDQNGDHWVGTWSGGLHRFNEDTRKFDRFMPEAGNPNSLSSIYIWSLLADSKGYLWIGTQNEDLDRYHIATGKFEHFPHNIDDPKALSGYYMRDIFEDSEGTIWIATIQGLNRFNDDTQTFTRFMNDETDDSSIANNGVGVIFEDSRGILWLGTDGGLSRMDRKTEKFKSYHTSDGLPSDTVTGISEDNSGDLWLNTKKGLVRFNPEHETFHTFTKFNGLAGHVMPRPASYFSPKGVLYIGSTQGVTSFRPDRLGKNTYVPPLFITGFSIFNKSIPIEAGEEAILTKDIRLTDTITLNYKQSMFSFDYAALSFRNPEKNRFSYRMEGFDDQWIDAQNKQSATYTNLSDGKYVFTVKGSNNDGIWNEDGRSITVIQLPPPWKTWWAYTIYTCIFIGAIAQLIYSQYRKRQIVEEQNRILEVKVAERTAQLSKKNQDIQAMLSNMRQGLFTVQTDGTIHPEYSRFLEQIFETPKIAGEVALELLFKDSTVGSDLLDKQKVTMEAVIGEDVINFDFNSELLATEYELIIGDKHKTLSLDWNPITEENIVEKLMVTVRDVTQLRKMESEAEAQKRELEIVGQLLKVPAKKYISFELSTSKFLSDNKEKLLNSEDYSESTIALLFRNMHTIKGNCRTYQLNYLSNIVHDVESTYSKIKAENGKGWDKDALLADLEKVEAGLTEYANVYHNVLGRDQDHGSAVNDHRAIEGIRKYVGMVQHDRPKILDRLQLLPVEAIISEVFSSPLAEVLEDIIKSLPSIADQLGKAFPDVKIHANNIQIREDSHELMNNIFSHLLRNCIDHGIEAPDEREAINKPKQGTIEISSSIHHKKLRLHVKDDGKGINISALYNKGLEQGLWQQDSKPSTLDIAQAIFESGVSTKEQVTDISGRGVGMDAVKQFLLDIGGDIELAMLEEKEEGQDFVAFETIVTLPENTFIQVVEPHQ